MRLSVPEFEEAERLLRELAGSAAARGRVGILLIDRQRLALDTAGIADHFPGLPEVLHATVARLTALAAGVDQPEVARAALHHLYRLIQDRGEA
jgi:hypothetical protein